MEARPEPAHAEYSQDLELNEIDEEEASAEAAEEDHATLSDQENDIAELSSAVTVEEVTRVRDIGGLSVDLEFCFPSQRMSLRELSALGIGSSFKVNCALEERLVVRVNGQIVGGGHLVDLDGILGLKVSDWSLSPVECPSKTKDAID